MWTYSNWSFEFLLYSLCQIFVKTPSIYERLIDDLSESDIVHHQTFLCVLLFFNCVDDL